MKNKSYGLTILLFYGLTIFLLSPETWAQTVNYEYDAAGNRILRTKIIKLTQLGSNTNSPVSDGSDTEAISDQARVEIRHDDLLGERKVTIYPNPTQGLIRIEFQGYGVIKDARLLLFNMQGKLLRQINKAEPSNTLDLSSYPAGMYILQMIEGKAKSEWKIIKE